GQGVIRIVVNDEDRSGALYSSRRFYRPGNFLDRHVKNFDIGHALDANVAAFPKCPACIIVNLLLRIVGAPVLIIEQFVGYATVWLIHSNDVTAGRELTSLSLRFLILLAVSISGAGSSRSLGRNSNRELSRCSRNFASLHLKQPQ